MLFNFESQRNLKRPFIIKLYSLIKYGFVNYVLEELVLRNFGEEIWTKIK